MVWLPIPPRRRSTKILTLSPHPFLLALRKSPDRAYLGMSDGRLAGVEPSVPLGAGAAPDAGAAVGGIAAGPVDVPAGAGAVLPTVLMTPARSEWPAADRAAVAVYAIPIVARKKIDASTAVERDRKLADPLAPKRLPEAPPPNAAPMSAPLPCCSRISTMTETAQIT